MSRRSLHSASEGPVDKKPRLEHAQGQVASKPNSEITLVSSDEVEFKVDRYQLMSISCVFRNMLNIDASPIIPLVDSVIESASIIRAVLDLINQATMTISLPTTVYVYRFLQKYEMTLPIRHLEHIISDYILTTPGSDKADYGLIFLMGALMDRVDFCIKAIQSRKGFLGSYSFEMFSMIPPIYVHTLLQARKEISEGDMELGHYLVDSVAKAFERKIKTHGKEVASLSETLEPKPRGQDEIFDHLANVDGNAPELGFLSVF